MLNNFIYAKKKSLFEQALNNGEVLDEAIVFIEDTKEIWNHGTYFDCSPEHATKSELAKKVDKVTGKLLSTEDFTTDLKTRVEGLNVYKKIYRLLLSLPSESSGWYTIAKVDDTESSLFQVSTGGHSDVTFTVSTGWGGNPGGSLTILNSFYSNDTGDINGNHVHVKQIRIRKYNNKLHVDLDLKKPISNASNYVNIVISAFTNAGHDLLENELALSDSLGTVVQTFELQNLAIMADKVVTKTITADNLATVAISGNYNDLTNKPTIPAAQVNADWNATSGKAQILNKPTIPSAVTESTVSGWGFATEQWVNEQNFLKEHQDISNKVDKDDNAPKLTAGFAGNLVGRGESTSEEISFRPSGGETSIEDGTAHIERLKGNTVVWNQRIQWSVMNNSAFGLTFSSPRDGVAQISGTYTGSLTTINVRLTKTDVPIPIGHKFIILSNSDEVKLRVQGSMVYDGIYDAADGYVFDPVIQLENMVTGQEVNITFSPTLLDITQMFGAGNEPDTIKEFNARKPIGIDEYAYNEGELISTTADEIKSVGFNAIDSLSPDKAVHISTGDIYNNVGTFATDYIKVLPNTQYYISQGKGTGWGVWLNSEKEVISSTGALNAVVLSPFDASYLRMTMSSADGCINLSHTGYRNGEYEPYEELRRSIPISEIKDSEGNVLFPNGLLSAGSVYDEITATKAIKRIGMVDMGTLNWDYSDNTPSYFYANISNAKLADRNSVANARCVPYESSTYAQMILGDKLLTMFYAMTPGVNITDSSYTDAAAFKAAMSGVMLYYELAEPIEVDLPEPINMDYEVSDFGTEEVISDTPTTPLKADIIYQFNAVDRIRDNSSNIKALDAKLGDINTILESIINS